MEKQLRKHLQYTPDRYAMLQRKFYNPIRSKLFQPFKYPRMGEQLYYKTPSPRKFGLPNQWRHEQALQSFSPYGKRKVYSRTGGYGFFKKRARYPTGARGETARSYGRGKHAEPSESEPSDGESLGEEGGPEDLKDEAAELKAELKESHATTPDEFKKWAQLHYPDIWTLYTAEKKYGKDKEDPVKETAGRMKHYGDLNESADESDKEEGEVSDTEPSSAPESDDDDKNDDVITKMDSKDLSPEKKPQ